MKKPEEWKPRYLTPEQITNLFASDLQQAEAVLALHSHPDPVHFLPEAAIDSTEKIKTAFV